LDKSCPVEHPQRNVNELLGRWAPLVTWVAQVVAAAPVLGDALAERSRAVQVTGTVGAWTWWTVGLALLLVPTTVSLTAIRTIAPAGVLGVLWAAMAGGVTAGVVALGLASTIAATVLVFTAELGRRFAQGSAYGDETRFPLRPPGVLVAGPIPLFWLLAVVPSMVGPIALAARAWVPGVLLTAFGGWFSWVVGQRFHRLSRRWLVFVPAGLVVHDHVVLAETSMFASAALAGCELAPAGTEAFDLSAAAAGTAIEVRLATDGDKIVLAPTKDKPQGPAYHVRSFLVMPSRPGAALAEARRRGVGGFPD